MNDLVAFFNQNNGIAIIISSISVLISAVAVSVSFYYNFTTRRQNIKSQEPQLSMRIEKEKGALFLLIQNNGKTAAKDIKVDILNIQNNGEKELMLDSLFSQTIELYPTEIVRSMIAISGDNMATGYLYPKIDVSVSYKIPGKRKKIALNRTITFLDYSGETITANVNIDLKEITKLLKANARATIRTANYFDGNQIAVFDEMDILSEHNFRTLMRDTAKIKAGSQNGKSKKSPKSVVSDSRTEKLDLKE